MKKILTLSLSRLHTEESFGFLKDVENEYPKLPTSQEETPAILTTAVNNSTTANTAFDDVLEGDAADPNVEIMMAADAKRDKRWRGVNAYVKAMCNHPDEEVAAKAEEFKAIFDRYGDPTSLSLTEESGVLHNLVADLNVFATDEFEKIGLTAWTDELEAAMEEFQEASAERNRIKASQLNKLGQVKEKRKAAEEAYRVLVNTVNSLVTIYGDTDYATFIDRVNARIDRQKTTIKTRDTRNKKVKEEEEKPTEEGGSGFEPIPTGNN